MDIAVLRERAARRAVESVRINYSDDQLNALKDDLARVELLRDDEEEMFAEQRTAHNERKKELSEEAMKLKRAIRMRFADEDRECLFVPNYDAGMMEIYEEATGLLVQSRRLRPEERQVSIPMGSPHPASVIH